MNKKKTKHTAIKSTTRRKKKDPDRSINQSINQSIESINRSINRTINQSIEPINQAIDQRINQSINLHSRWKEHMKVQEQKSIVNEMMWSKNGRQSLESGCRKLEEGKKATSDPPFFSSKDDIRGWGWPFREHSSSWCEIRRYHREGPPKFVKRRKEAMHY